MFLAGCLLDAALAPSGTVFGPMLVASWFAATARRFAEAVFGWLLVAVFTLVTVASLADLGDVGLRLARDDGGDTRTAALGGFLVVSGLLRLRPARPRRPATAAT